MAAEGWLDQIIGFIIPPALIGVIIYILWKPFKEPLSGLGGWISGLWGGIKNKAEGTRETSKYINYQ